MRRVLAGWRDVKDGHRAEKQSRINAFMGFLKGDVEVGSALDAWVSTTLPTDSNDLSGRHTLNVDSNASPLLRRAMASVPDTHKTVTPRTTVTPVKPIATSTPRSHPRTGVLNPATPRSSRPPVHTPKPRRAPVPSSPPVPHDCRRHASHAVRVGTSTPRQTTVRSGGTSLGPGGSTSPNNTSTVLRTPLAQLSTPTTSGCNHQGTSWQDHRSKAEELLRRSQRLLQGTPLATDHSLEEEIRAIQFTPDRDLLEGALQQEGSPPQLNLSDLGATPTGTR